MSHSLLEKEITTKSPLCCCTRRKTKERTLGKAIGGTRSEKQGTANGANVREWIRLKITPGQRPTSARGAEVFTGGAEGRFKRLPSPPPANGVIGQLAVAHSRARRAIRGYSRFPIFGLRAANLLFREFKKNLPSASEQRWTVIKVKKSRCGIKARNVRGIKPIADLERSPA